MAIISVGERGGSELWVVDHEMSRPIRNHKASLVVTVGDDYVRIDGLGSDQLKAIAEECCVLSAKLGIPLTVGVVPEAEGQSDTDDVLLSVLGVGDNFTCRLLDNGKTYWYVQYESGDDIDATVRRVNKDITTRMPGCTLVTPVVPCLD